jgi:hypothetical protein
VSSVPAPSPATVRWSGGEPVRRRLMSPSRPRGARKTHARSSARQRGVAVDASVSSTRPRTGRRATW